MLDVYQRVDCVLEVAHTAELLTYEVGVPLLRRRVPFIVVFSRGACVCTAADVLVRTL